MTRAFCIVLAVALPVGVTTLPAQTTRPSPTIPLLIEELGSSNDSIVESAVTALVAKGAPAIPALRDALTPRVEAGQKAFLAERRSNIAASVLAEMGVEGLSVLVEALRDSTTRSQATNGLRYAETPNVSVTRLLEDLLSDTSATIRLAAVAALSTDGPRADVPSEHVALVAAFRRALADPDSEVRDAALEGIRTAPAIGRELEAELIRTASDPSAEVRASAMFVLGYQEDPTREIVAVLQDKMFDDPDSTVRWHAISALGSLGPGASEAVPALVRVLDSPEHQRRYDAAESLGEIGVERLPDSIASSVDQGLRARLSDSQAYVASAAARALSRLGTHGVAGLIDALRSPRDTLAADAAMYLGHLAATRESIEALLRAFADQRPLVRNEAADAIAGFGPSQAGALHTRERSADPHVRAAAGRALRYLAYAGRLGVAGRCYEFRRGDWSGGGIPGDDSLFTAGPPVVRFSYVRGRYEKGPGSPKLEAVAANGAKETIMGPGLWNPVAGKRSLSLFYSNGFSGVFMELTVRGRALEGTAQTFWDFPRPGQKQAIHGQQVTCQ